MMVIRPNSEKVVSMSSEMLELYDSENYKLQPGVAPQERRRQAMEAVVKAILAKKSIWRRLYERAFYGAR